MSDPVARNLLPNPRPAASTPNPWQSNNVTMQVEDDSIVLTSGQGDHCFTKTTLHLLADSYVFSAHLKSTNANFDPFSNRALLVTAVNGASVTTVGTTLYVSCPARYVCAFTIAEECDVEFRMYAHSTASGRARWADAMVCTADDWQALRAMTPPIDYFDGGRIVTSGTLIPDGGRLA